MLDMVIVFLFFLKLAGILQQLEKRERTNNIHAAFIYIWQQMAMF